MMHRSSWLRFCLTEWVGLKKVVFYSLLILGSYIAFTPTEGGLQPDLNDKFLHVSGFFVLAILCHLAHPFLSFFRQSVGLLLFGAMIECVQAFLPYRSFSLLDFVADLAGIAMYYMLFASYVSQIMRDIDEPD